MPNWAISLLKWTAAVIALVLVVNYTAPRAWQELRGAVELEQTGDDEDELPEADPEETDPEETIEDEQVATLDLAERNGTIQQATAESILLGEEGGQQMLIGFDHIPVDTACILEVRLGVAVLEGAEARIHVLPAQLLNPHELTDGGPLPADTIIEGAEPSVALSDGSAGVLIWDILDIYTLASREAPSDTVMLAVAPQIPEEVTEFAMILGAVEGGPQTAPRIQWSAVEGCDAAPGGRDTPGAAEEDEEAVEEEEPEPTEA